MTLSDKEINRNLISLRLVTLAHYGYVFAIGVMVDYISKLTGEGSEMLFFIESITAILLMAVCLFIGILSDLHSRKFFLKMSCLIQLTGWFILLLKPSLFPLILGMILCDFAASMGKTSHTLYETLEGTKWQANYNKQEEKLSSFPQFALMIGLPIAGFLYEIDIRIPVFLNLVIGAFALISTFFFTDPPRIKMEGKNPFILLKKIAFFIGKTKRLRWFILFAAVIESFTTMSLIIFQAHYLKIFENLVLFSSLLVGVYAIRALGANQAAYLIKNLGHYGCLWFVLTGLIIFLCLAGISSSPIFMTFYMFAFMLFRGAINPINNVYMNAMITSDRRATAFSMLMTVKGIMFIFVNLMIALGIKFFGTELTLIFSGIWLIIFCAIPLYMFMLSDIRHRNEWAHPEN